MYFNGRFNSYQSAYQPKVAVVKNVYKSIKCASMSQVPREATALFIWILLGMAAAAAILAGVVKVMERV